MRAAGWEAGRVQSLCEEGERDGEAAVRSTWVRVKGGGEGEDEVRMKV